MKWCESLKIFLKAPAGFAIVTAQFLYKGGTYMALAAKIQDAIERSSWIRKMFEEGARLKALHGGDKVFDFSLGNPDLEPPESFPQVLNKVIAEFVW